MLIPGHKFSYCLECKHIYYEIPPDKVCRICGNQLDPNDIIDEDDLLICETCHTIYPADAWQKILPGPELQELYLCACEYQCPTESVLRKKQKKTFVGNIILAAMFQCSNCRAIFVRGHDERQKDCSLCRSRFVYQITMDMKKQKPLYNCANPSHGIRLKLKDLITENNLIIAESMKAIKQKDFLLRQEYEKRLKEIDNIKGLGKNSQKNAMLAQLEKWGITQRWQIYAVLRLSPIRCAVYKDDLKQPTSLSQKTSGCGAIAEIKIRKTLETDNQQTVIKRKTTTPSADSLNEETSSIPDRPMPEGLLEALSAITGTPLGHTSQPVIAQATSGDSALNTSMIQPTPDVSTPIPMKVQELSPAEGFFSKLPPLASNQLYIKFELIALSKDIDKNIFKEQSVNYGVLPIQLSSKATSLRIGRESLLQAFWTNPELFETQPFIFDNINPLSSQGSEMILQWQNNELLLYESPQRLNRAILELNTKNLTESFSLKTGINPKWIRKIRWDCRYALDKIRFDIPMRYAIYISFQLPEKLTMEV